MEFWTTAAGAAFGVIATTLIKTWFDHYVSGASRIQAQQDDDLAAIASVTYDVRDRAIAYWSEADNNNSTLPAAGAITGRLTFIGQISDELFAGDSELSKAVGIEINRFDDSVSHGDFMVKGRAPDSSRILDIEQNAYRLIYRSRRCRRKLPRPVLKQ